MKIHKTKLLLIAGGVWALAGANILRIGLSSFFEVYRHMKLPLFLLLIFASVVILLLFSLMFRKTVKRNTKRILAYSGKKSVFAFFDFKGYLLMIFMMGLGITLRSGNWLPTSFFAFFYTGLGTALALAGGVFVYNYCRTLSDKKDR